MAFTPDKQDWVSRMRVAAKETEELMQEIDELYGTYFKLGFNSGGNALTDGDLDEPAANTGHLTATDFAAVITAFEAMQTALGNYSSGHRGNLLKIQGG